MQFLDPKTDLAFRKIFGSADSREILISFLNAVLGLSDANVIVDVTIIDPFLAPKIVGMKSTYLDVRVKDERGRHYIIEMQVLNVEGFEKRVLYNACKAYVNQIARGDDYHMLTDVVAVTITDFTLFSALTRAVSHLKLRAEENPLIGHEDLALVFAELPKFNKTEAELASTLDRWLYFLKNAEDLTAIPRSLAVEPAIVQALEIANRAAWTREELDDLEKQEMWIGDQIRIAQQAQMTKDAQRKAEQAEREAQEVREKLQVAEQKAKVAQQKAEVAEQKGRDGGKAEMLLRQLGRRFGTISPETDARVRAAESNRLDEWIDQFVDARTLADVFGDQTS